MSPEYPNSLHLYKESKMLKLLKSRSFWSFTIGVAGTIFGVFSYFDSKKEIEPVWTIKNQAAKIYDKDNSTPLIRLIREDSTLIDENVFLTSIVLWNAGELPITKADMRKDFTIAFKDSVTLLDYKIVAQTDPLLNKFELIEEETGLMINWGFFDPGDGAEIQLIYASDTSAQLSINGLVLGSKLKEVVSKPKDKEPLLFDLLYLALFGSLLYAEVRSISREKKQVDGGGVRKGRMLYRVVLIVLAVSGITLAVIDLVRMALFYYSPPF